MLLALRERLRSRPTSILPEARPTRKRDGPVRAAGTTRRASSRSRDAPEHHAQTSHSAQAMSTVAVEQSAPSQR